MNVYKFYINCINQLGDIIYISNIYWVRHCVNERLLDSWIKAYFWGGYETKILYIHRALTTIVFCRRPLCAHVCLAEIGLSFGNLNELDKICYIRLGGKKN